MKMMSSRRNGLEWVASPVRMRQLRAASLLG